MYNKKVLSKIDLGKQTKKDPFKGDIIYDSMGQWKFPGQPTRIPSNEITMQGVPYPVYGIDNTGYAQVMQPGADYTFPGDYVDEYPMAKKGGSLPKRPKKKNKRAWSRSIEATNILFTENPLFSQPKPRRNKVYDPNAKYYQEGGKLGPISLNSGKYAAKKYPFGKFSGVFTKQDGGYIETELTDAEIEEYRKGGYIVEDLTQAQSGLSQNQSKEVRNLPEIKVTPNLKKRLNLTGRPEYAKGHYDPYGVPDNTLENIVEIFDPTGLSSWDDVARSYRKSGMSPETALEVFGTLPLIGKLGKLAKPGIHLKKYKGLDKTLYDILPKSKSVSKALSKTATAGRATDIFQAVNEWFKRNGGDISIPKLNQAQKGTVVISDPNEYKYRRAMYDDSLNLYKAYQFQKSHINPKPALQEFVNHYNQMRREYPEMRRPGDPRTLTVEQLMKTRKANFNRQLPKYSHKDYQEVKRNPRGGFDPMDRRTGDYKIYDYYKSLPFNNDVALGNYSSPDIWHSKINPSGSYFDGIAFSPKYKKPVEPVEFGQSEVIESKPVPPKQVISDSVQTENMLPVQLPQRDRMVLPLGRSYHHEGKFKQGEGGQEYYGEFEKIIDPSSGKVRYVPTGKKSKFSTLHDPTFKDGGEMYDASGLTPFIKAQTGLVATGEEDLYSAGELEPVTVTAEMPDWARFQEEYQNIKPWEDYLAEEKKKYLKRGNKALNKMAGLSEENFPESVEEKFWQQYNQKMNTYATRKLGKKQGFNPRRRGEWVDELSPRELEVVSQSKYGSKLNPDVWSRFLSGAQGAANTLMIGQPVNFNIPGYTKREMKEARENPFEAFELLAPTDLPGIAIANAATNANIENPSIISGETMANVNPLATVGVNPLLALDLAGIPTLAKGIYTGTKTLGKGAATLGKKAGKVTGNTLREYLMQQKGKSYKPKFIEATDVPNEAELKRLSEIEKAQSVKAYHFRKKEAPIPEYYNTPEEYEAAIGQYNTNLKAVQNYVKNTDLSEDEIRDIFGREKEEILNLKLETPVPMEQRAPEYDDLDYGDYDIGNEYFNSLVDEPPISSYRRPTVPSQVTRRGETTEDLGQRTRGYGSIREIVDDIPAQMSEAEFQEYDTLYSQLLADLRTNPQDYNNNSRAAINELGNIISRPNVAENFNPDIITDSGSGLRVPQSLQEPLMRLENKANAPVSGSDIRTAYQDKEAIPALDPNARGDVKQLVTSFFADRFDSPKEALKYVTNTLDKGIKESKVGDVITGSTNTSHDSYKIQMDYIFKNAGKEGLSEPVFLGYEPMNNFGFLSKTKSVSNEDIFKRINVHLNSLQKRTGKSINLKSHPPILNTNEFGETIVMLPQYGLRKIGETTGKLKKKQEGGIVSELSKKEIDDLIAQGYIIEEV